MLRSSGSCYDLDLDVPAELPPGDPRSDPPARELPGAAAAVPVPVSDQVFAAMGWLCFAWVLLGSWVAVFPGTMEKLFGLDYAFKEIWGVSQAEFEIFSLGTLAVLLVLGLVGYARGRAYVVMSAQSSPPLSPPPLPHGRRVAR